MLLQGRSRYAARNEVRPPGVSPIVEKGSSRTAPTDCEVVVFIGDAASRMAYDTEHDLPTERCNGSFTNEPFISAILPVDDPALTGLDGVPGWVVRTPIAGFAVLLARVHHQPLRYGSTNV